MSYRQKALATIFSSDFMLHETEIVLKIQPIWHLLCQLKIAMSYTYYIN